MDKKILDSVIYKYFYNAACFKNEIRENNFKPFGLREFKARIYDGMLLSDVTGVEYYEDTLSLDDWKEFYKEYLKVFKECEIEKLSMHIESMSDILSKSFSTKESFIKECLLNLVSECCNIANPYME